MKNRTLIGFVCIVLAVLVTFVVSPLVNKMSEGKTSAVRLTTDIVQGTAIKEDNIEVVKVAKSSLPDSFVADKKEVVGKYANGTLYKGDIVTSFKITDDSNSSENILSSMPKGKVAVSITIDSFAGGLSGKLENGDIVSICVTGSDNKTVIPDSLKYVKVITTTTSGGVDENNVEPNEDGSFDLPSTVTVLASVSQAKELAGYEKNAKMHIALVYRGDESKAQTYLDKQDEILKNSEVQTNE